MTTKSKSKAHGPAQRVRIQVPLCDLGLAPENLRFDEPEDEDIPRLAETILAADVIYPPLVRKGRKGEQPFMVLDGRRRRFALLRLAAEGRIAEDRPIECLLAEDRAGQAAAAVLPNAEVEPVHTADIIRAIGNLRASKFGTRAIADALGYDELEVKRLEVVAGVHADALAAFKRGRINLRQVRMFTRIKDMKRQGELAAMALSGLFNEHLVHSAGLTGRVTETDERFGLVKHDQYAAAGGRMSVDLFDELPPEVLDVETLDELWRERAALLTAPLRETGLELSFGQSRGYAAPEGLEHLPNVHWGAISDERRAAFSAANDKLAAAEDVLVEAEGDAWDDAFGPVLLAELEIARLTAGRGEVVAGLVTPVDDGLTVTFYQRPAAPEPVVEAVRPDPGDDADEQADREHEGDDDEGDGAQVPAVNGVVVSIAGVTHIQHAARTEIATQGLIRDLADKPDAALIVLTAHMFDQLVLYGAGFGQSVLQLSAHANVRGCGPEDGLAGTVWGRLDAQEEAYHQSGLRPIGYVSAMTSTERLDLLANLVAATVDLREARTDQVRKATRVQAVEIAALCGADLARRWTPDQRFLDLHSQPQLREFLADMEVAVPADAKRKGDLVRVTVESAAAKRWIPDFLRWPVTEAEPAAEAEAAAVEGEPLEAEQPDEARHEAPERAAEAA